MAASVERVVECGAHRHGYSVKMNRANLRTGVVYAYKLRRERYIPVKVLDDAHTYMYNWYAEDVNATVPAWKRDDEWTVTRPEPGPFPHGVLVAGMAVSSWPPLWLRMSRDEQVAGVRVVDPTEVKSRLIHDESPMAFVGAPIGVIDNRRIVGEWAQAVEAKEEAERVERELSREQDRKNWIQVEKEQAELVVLEKRMRGLKACAGLATVAGVLSLLMDSQYPPPFSFAILLLVCGILMLVTHSRMKQLED